MKKRITCLLVAVLLFTTLMSVTAGATTPITTVDILATYPMVTEHPDFVVWLSNSVCRVDESVNSGGYHNGVRWRNVPTGIALSENDTFRAGVMYELSIFLTANSGYTFDVNSTQIQINLDSSTTFSYVQNDTDRVVVSLQMAAESIYVNQVSLSGLAAPVADALPDYIVSLADTTCMLNPSVTATQQGGVVWYDLTEGQYISVGTKYKAGHEYWAEIHLDAVEGYTFALNATAYVDGRAFSVGGTGESIVILVDFPGIKEEVHTHVPSDWRITQVYHYKACTTCGDMLDQEDHRWSPRYHAVDASGHAYQCADCKCYDTVKPHNPGPAATETTPQTCKDCDYVIAPAKKHTHELSKVPQVPATCTLEGNIEYYVCSGCSECFIDSEGKDRITETMSVSLSALGHTTSDDWTYDDNYHWRICTVCEEILIETKMVHDMASEKCTTCGYGGTVPEETVPAVSQPQPQTGKESALPWWALVLISLAAVCVGLGGGILLMKLTKKK